MSAHPSESESLAWTDLVLAAMGLVLVGGLAVGVFSAVPMRVAGSVGSVIATAMWAGSVVANPDERTA
jgi:hypothetical protein